MLRPNDRRPDERAQFGSMPLARSTGAASDEERNRTSAFAASGSFA